jgi:hypothetical protein
MRTLLIFSLCTGALRAQHSRDSWKLKTSAQTPYSLANAPLSSGERAQIYRVVDGATAQYSVRDAQSNKQREAVMSSLVGLIGLALDGSEQVLVRGPNSFCGHSGNCPVWVFVRDGARLRLVLAAGANSLIVRPTSSHGFRDLATEWTFGAFEAEYRDYAWDGIAYKQADCYLTEYPEAGNSSGPPTIAACQ